MITSRDADCCKDCGVKLDVSNAFHPYGDCPAERCKACEAAAWARLERLNAGQPGIPGNTKTNVWD